MSYKLSVSKDFSHITQWTNFCENVRKNSLTMDDELANHNAKDIKNTIYIVFDSEEDATAFMLKWM